MARYNYKCSNCDVSEELEMSVSDFLFSKSNGAFENKKCKKCGDITEFYRIFESTSSKISKSRCEILAEAKDEARKIVEKVKSGDTRIISEVYGEQE